MKMIITTKNKTEFDSFTKVEMNVGDVFDFTLKDGEEVQAMVVVKGQDKALCILVDCLKDEYPMNSNHRTEGGWEGSMLRKTLNSEILERFPDGVRNAMVAFSNGDYLRLPTEREIFGRTYYSEEDDGVKQFEPMKDRRNRIAFQGKNGAWEFWWLSAVSNSTDFCLVHASGGASTDNAGYSRGVRPLFIISNL